MNRIAVALCMCLIMCSAVSVCSAQETSEWRYRLVPYLWFSSINGDVAVRGVPAHIDASFSDLKDSLDAVLQIDLEARKGRWGYFVDPIYVKLSSGVSANGTPANVGFTQWLVEFGGIRQLWSKPSDYQCRASSLDLLFGGRYWNLSSRLDVNGVGSVSEDQSWVDPIIGLQYETDLSKLWEASVRFDAGGFGVGSDFTWNAALILGYRTSRSGQLVFGYRVLGVDRESGSGANFFRYDVTYNGPILGYSFNF